jgi:hypothetical protein
LGVKGIVNVATSQSHSPAYRLKVSPYDRVSSMLLALLILLGVAVLVLLVIWLTSRIFLRQTAVAVELMELGTGEGPLGGGSELAEPVEEQIEPDQPPVEQTLTTIAEAVALKTAQLDDPVWSGRAGPGKGPGSGGGSGGGTGSGSGVARRWEVRFIKGNTLETYARQLDFFGIELGVLMPGNRVIYVFNLSKRKPDTRTAAADQEKRFYLTWRSGELEEADRELLARAGVQSAGRIILKFLTPQLEAHLAGLEKARAGRYAEKVRRTRFEVRDDGAGRYSFIVVDQSFKY